MKLSTLLLDTSYSDFYSLIVNGICLFLTVIELGFTIGIYNTRSIILFLLFGVFCLLNVLIALVLEGLGLGQAFYTALLPSIIMMAANLYFLIRRKRKLDVATSDTFASF